MEYKSRLYNIRYAPLLKRIIATKIDHKIDVNLSWNNHYAVCSCYTSFYLNQVHENFLEYYPVADRLLQDFKEKNINLDLRFEEMIKGTIAHATLGGYHNIYYLADQIPIQQIEDRVRRHKTQIPYNGIDYVYGGRGWFFFKTPEEMTIFKLENA